MNRFLLKTTGLCALLASVATICMFQPTLAAERDAASGQATGKRQHTPKLDEFIIKQADVDAQIEALTLQLSQLQASCSEMTVLAGEVDVELESIVQVSQDNLMEIDEAFRVFTEQVAPVLDPETVTLVSGKLQVLQSSSTSIGIDPSPPIVESVEPVNEKLDELLALLNALSQASKEVKDKGVGKKEYVGHVSLLK